MEHNIHFNHESDKISEALGIDREIKNGIVDVLNNSDRTNAGHIDRLWDFWKKKSLLPETIFVTMSFGSKIPITPQLVIMSGFDDSFAQEKIVLENGANKVSDSLMDWMKEHLPDVIAYINSKLIERLNISQIIEELLKLPRENAFIGIMFLPKIASIAETIRIIDVGDEEDQ